MPEAGTEERVGGKVAGAASAIAAIHLSARVLGFVEKMLTAKYFGTSDRADAYTVAVKVPSTIFYGCEKILNPSFIPSFIDIRKREGEQAAWRLAGTTILLQSIILGALVIVGQLLAQPLVLLVAPGYAPGAPTGSPEKVELTVRLMKTIFLSVMFLGISSTTYCILNAHKRFATPALGDAFWKVGTVAGLIFLYGRLDVFALAIGFVAGAVLKLGTHVVALGRALLKLRLGMTLSNPTFRRMILLMLPMAFGFAYSELRALFDIRFASPLSPGAVAALNYSRTITDLPYQVVAYALGIALFPFLAEHASSERWTDLKSLFMSSMRMLVFLFVPATVVLFILSEPTLRVVYQSGEFNEESLRLTAPALEFYALGMLAQALECVILQTFYSLKNTLVPTLIGLGTTALHIGLSWWLVSTLSADDPRGLALAYTLARYVKVIVAFGFLAVALKGLPLGPHGGFVAKVLLASAAMAVVMHLAYGGIIAWHPLTGRKDAIAVFGACAVAGGAVYAIASALLGVPEVRSMARRIGERLKRG